MSLRTQRGLGAVAAVLVLVMLAALAAAIVRLGSAQQTGFSQQIDATRANLAAQAGIEWGLYQALRSGSCAGGTTLDLGAELGMRVTVSCSRTAYNEGESDSAPGTPRVLGVYTIDAIACNAAACPDAAAAVTPHYVERRRQVHATD